MNTSQDFSNWFDHVDFLDSLSERRGKNYLAMEKHLDEANDDASEAKDESEDDETT